jgi:Excreted virulence factor EspC, type VII ESX diderm
MSEPIHIGPDVMRTVANHHDEVADKIDAARLAGADIHAAVGTYGPIMHQVKAAVADLLARRDAALLEHAQTHRNAADELRRQAANFTAADGVNAERLRF